MINQKLQNFNEEEVKPIGDIMTQATIEMYYAVITKFLPTPTKIHYLFNLRDISKVHSLGYLFFINVMGSDCLTIVENHFLRQTLHLCLASETQMI